MLPARLLVAPLLTLALVTPWSAAGGAAATAGAAPAAAPGDRVLTTRWASGAALQSGRLSGLRVANGAVRLDRPHATTRMDDPYAATGRRTYEVGHWTSPWVGTGFDARSLIPSWNAVARNGTLVRVQVRSRSGSARSSWDHVATWGWQTSSVHRHSGSSQADDLNRLLTDTVVSNGDHRMRSWQVQVALMRPKGSTATPRLRSVGAVAASFLTRSRPVSRTTMNRAVELGVPRKSQMVHRGEFPKWGGGGEAWCSPTSTTMVLRHFGEGPPRRGWAGWTHGKDGSVDHAARYTYDHAYRGTGNWGFNTAYAGFYGLDAFVTRMASLRDAEAFVKKGIPVVASVKFGRGELDGAPISATNGHLLVIVGFTADGRVIANDPAAPRNSTVRRVYDRAQLERAWLNGSGGVSYVIRPRGRALPADTARW